jgi:hypothetical protein
MATALPGTKCQALMNRPVRDVDSPCEEPHFPKIGGKAAIHTAACAQAMTASSSSARRKTRNPRNSPAARPTARSSAPIESNPIAADNAIAPSVIASAPNNGSFASITANTSTTIVNGGTARPKRRAASLARAAFGSLSLQRSNATRLSSRPSVPASLFSGNDSPDQFCQRTGSGSQVRPPNWMNPRFPNHPRNSKATASMRAEQKNNKRQRITVGRSGTVNPKSRQGGKRVSYSPQRERRR